MAKATRRRLNWVNIVAMAVLHGFAVYALYVVGRLVVDPPPFGDVVKLVVLFAGLATFTGFSITVGYHRLFTHTGFSCGLPLRLTLLVGGGLALEGPVDHWVRDHRQHHRKSDVTRVSVIAAGLDPSRVGYDPHSPYEYPGIRGFLWAHVAWLFVHHDYPTRPAPDLDNDRWIQLQKRYYLVFVVASFALPWAVAGWNGLLIGGVLRIVWVLNVTWAINSVTHLLRIAFADSAIHPLRRSFIYTFLRPASSFSNLVAPSWRENTNDNRINNYCDILRSSRLRKV